MPGDPPPNCEPWYPSTAFARAGSERRGRRVIRFGDTPKPGGTKVSGFGEGGCLLPEGREAHASTLLSRRTACSPSSVAEVLNLNRSRIPRTRWSSRTDHPVLRGRQLRRRHQQPAGDRKRDREDPAQRVAPVRIARPQGPRRLSRDEGHVRHAFRDGPGHRPVPAAGARLHVPDDGQRRPGEGQGVRAAACHEGAGPAPQAADPPGPSRRAVVRSRRVGTAGRTVPTAGRAPHPAL